MLSQSHTDVKALCKSALTVLTHENMNTHADVNVLSYVLFLFSRKEIYTNMSEFFVGKWSDGVKKSYTDRKGNSGEVDRFVAKQPFVFKESEESE